MTYVLERDVEELNRALSTRQDPVDVSLSHETIATLTRLLHDHPNQVDPGIDDEVSPTQAAAMLRVSRPVIHKLMNSGALPFRMVGTHHRIQVRDVDAYQAAERIRRRKALAEYARVENELGL